MSGHAQRAETTSEIIAKFVSQAQLKNIAEKVRDIAKLHLLDGFATMLGGADEAASCLVRRQLSQFRAKRESTVIGTGIKLPAQQAALTNGVQGHVLDFDDAQLASLRSRPFGQQTHPTSPVLAASLALAERLQATGADLLAAYIIGVEVACRLADAVDPSHYIGGFHPTGTFGTFGATAACAHLLKLNARQVSWALGIAGTFASGIRANRGTMAKALNAGRAAENGVVAATLAAEDFTASANVFDDPMGYFSAACRNKVDCDLLRFGKPFFLLRPGISVKLYPCAGVLHPTLDILLDLAKRYDIDSKAINSIKVILSPTAALPLVYDRPKDGLQAKFSLPFAVSVSVIDRKAGLEQFTDQRVMDERVQRLMRKVELVRRPPSRRAADGTIDSEVAILLQDGRSYERRAAIARGYPAKAPSLADIEDKFRQCGRRVLRPGKIEKFLKNFWSLERAPSVAKWLRPLRPSR